MFYMNMFQFMNAHDGFSLEGLLTLICSMLSHCSSKQQKLFFFRTIPVSLHRWEDHLLLLR